MIQVHSEFSGIDLFQFGTWYVSHTVEDDINEFSYKLNRQIYSLTRRLSTINTMVMNDAMVMNKVHTRLKILTNNIALGGKITLMNID